MSVSNVAFGTLQDFLRDEAGVTQISSGHRDVIEKPWGQKFAPMIVLNNSKIIDVINDHAKLSRTFVVCVRGDGFDAVQLKALNEAIIGAAQEAGLSWPFATDDATGGAK